MGLDVKVDNKNMQEWDHDQFSHTMKSLTHNRPTEVKVVQGHWNAPFPEVHMTMHGPDYTYRGVSGKNNPYPSCPSTISLRIHGVTVRELLNTLMEDRDIRKYLVGAVDHIRKTGCTMERQLTEPELAEIAMIDG